jgi:hypothetical protein
MGFLRDQQYKAAYDSNESVHKVALLRWDTATLAWVKYTGVAPSGVSQDVNVLTDLLTDAQLRATPLEVLETWFTKRVDEVSSSLTYLGYAVPGTAESASGWLMIAVSKVGTVTAKKFKNGSTSFNTKWDDRAAGSYS